MQQLLLNFPHHNQYFKQDFILTEANKQAFEYLEKWPSSWGINPYPYFVLLHGPASSGKTHLAHIWQREAQAYLVSPNENLLETNLNKYNCYIFEDIENKVWDEKYLFHIFNTLNELKKYALFTTQYSPYDLSFSLKDLKSRINSIFTLTISCPSSELLKIMLLKRFSEKELKVSLEVVNFLVTRIPRQFSEILNIVDILDRAAMEQKRNITIPMIKEILAI